MDRGRFGFCTATCIGPNRADDREQNILEDFSHSFAPLPAGAIH